MAQKTDSQLTTEANIIRNETAIGANTALRVGTMLDNVIDSKINNDKIDADGTLASNSDSLVPSQKAVKTYVDLNTTGLLNDRGNYDASSNLFPTTGGSGTGGVVQKGDLWYISVAGTLGTTSVLVGYSIRALEDLPGQTEAKWAISNVGLGFVPQDSFYLSNDINLGTSTQYYPTQNAVYTYVNNQIALNLPNYPIENANNKIQDITLDPNSSTKYPSNAAVSSFVAANLPSGWNLSGNSGTTPGTDFIGTTDAQDFVIKTNNTQRAIIGSTGDFSVFKNFASINSLGSSVGCSDGLYSIASLINDPSSTDGGYLYLQNNTGVASSLKATNLTSARTHQLPDADGTFVLSVNGTAPDAAGNVTIAGGGSVNTVKVSLTSVDILSLNGTNALTLIPAQGAGTLINVLRVWFKYNFVTNPYSGSGIYVQLGTAISIVSPVSGILSSGADCIVRPTMNTSAYNLIPSAVVNQSVSLSTVTAPAGGDSTLDVYITYDVITL